MAKKVKLTRLFVLLGLLTAVIGTRGAAEALGRYKFGINQTDSLPNWAFVTDLKDQAPDRGEYVAFLPPPNRFYPADMAFVKIVAGVPGDVVERRGRSFYVAGRFVGDAKTHSQDGEPMAPNSTGVIPKGRYFLVTPSKDSLDSRYAVIGLIDRSRIYGVSRPVL